MARDATFLAHVLESLEGLEAVEARAMFGGHGLYADGVFFAIVHRGRLWLRTDAGMRAELGAAGSGPFRPGAGQTLGSYWEAPADALEDPRVLTAWARRAIAARSTASGPRASGATRGGPRPAPPRRRASRVGTPRSGRRGRPPGR